MTTSHLPGYSYRAVAVGATAAAKPTWRGEYRHKGWLRGYWKAVENSFGAPISYMSREAALEGARWSAEYHQDEGVL